MAIEVKIPKISDGVESANVTEILVSEGDTIEKEQSLITVETDKASVEVPSSDAGTVKEIKVSEGDEVNVGDVILILEEDGEDSGEEGSDEEKKKSEEKEKQEKAEKDETGEKEEKEKEKEEKEKSEEDEEKEEQEKEEQKEEKEKEEKKEEKSAEKEEQEEETHEKKEENQTKSIGKEREEEKDEGGKEEKTERKSGEEESQDAADADSDEKPVPASPSVWRLARETGVNIREVKGSGPEGRITEEDVKQASKRKGEKSSGPDLPDFSQWGQVEREELSPVRKATARNTQQSWQTIPHVFQFGEADITGILSYIDENQDKAKEKGGKLTLTSVLVKLVASGLRQFPAFNASINMEAGELILKKYVHIGIAVDTDRGLLVPVIRDVDKKSIVEIAVEITETAKKARDGDLLPEDMEGGNFSISNLGGIGGTHFTPIVYHPQVAILGISRAEKKPVFIDGEFKPRDILPLSLSYDHRAIDGADGARFIEWIVAALEDPYKALLGA